MSETQMIEKLYTIKVGLKGPETEFPYSIVLGDQGFLEATPTLEDAITYLRKTGANVAQVVNGPEVYVVTWGPLLAPWEGEPG